MPDEETKTEQELWRVGEGPTEFKFMAPHSVWPVISDETGSWEALATDKAGADQIVADHNAAKKLAAAKAALRQIADPDIDHMGGYHARAAASAALKVLEAAGEDVSAPLPPAETPFGVDKDAVLGRRPLLE